MRTRRGRNTWTRWLASAVIVTMIAPASTLRAAGSAQTPAPPNGSAASGIRHTAPDCVLAGEHARLTACFDSVVARSRLVFRGGGVSNYYRVDMAPDDLRHGCANAFLPKVKRRAARTHAGNAVVQYYIEATGKDLMSARTRVADLKVVETAAECKGTVAESVPEAAVEPAPLDPQDPPFAQAASDYFETSPGDERTTEAPEGQASATAVPPKHGSSVGKTLLLTTALTGAIVAGALAIGPKSGTSGDGGGGNGGNGGSCSATSQCASVGTGCSGGPANVRCASDGLCHCCYDVNGRCQACSASSPCIDRNTTCVTGVCIFNNGVRP
jgi:hypothetical protein